MGKMMEVRTPETPFMKNDPQTFPSSLDLSTFSTTEVLTLRTILSAAVERGDLTGGKLVGKTHPGFRNLVKCLVYFWDVLLIDGSDIRRIKQFMYGKYTVIYSVWLDLRWCRISAINIVEVGSSGVTRCRSWWLCFGEALHWQHDPCDQWVGNWRWRNCELAPWCCVVLCGLFRRNKRKDSGCWEGLWLRSARIP